MADPAPTPVPDKSLETLIAHLKAPDVVTSHDVDPKILAAGLEDLKNRMGHAEFSHLKALSQVRANNDRVTAAENNIGGLATDRDEFRKQVRVATDLPNTNADKITELEARVQAVEGAVGAAPYKAPKPIEPAKPVADPVEPVADPVEPVADPVEPVADPVKSDSTPINSGLASPTNTPAPHF